MSTRGAIGRLTSMDPIRFDAVYHHWDSYCSGLGATLFHVRREYFHGSTDEMLAYVIDQHPGGWSSLNGKDIRLPAGYAETAFGVGDCQFEGCGLKQDAHLCQSEGAHPFLERTESTYPCVQEPSPKYGMHLGHEFAEDPVLRTMAERTPNCYCHGERAEEGWVVTQENAAGSGVEWVYAFPPDGTKMLVLSSYTMITGSEEKMIGFFGMGDDNAVWKPVAVIDLDGDEPEWDRVGSDEESVPA